MYLVIENPFCTDVAIPIHPLFLNGSPHAMSSVRGIGEIIHSRAESGISIEALQESGVISLVHDASVPSEILLVQAHSIRFVEGSEYDLSNIIHLLGFVFS